jgi:hypothetical protein
VSTQYEPGWELIGRKFVESGFDEPHAVLDAISGALAESTGTGARLLGPTPLKSWGGVNFDRLDNPG